MDQKEYEALLASIQQLIETSLLGCRPGNHHFRILGGLEETAQEHGSLYNGSTEHSGAQFPDANARGDSGKVAVE